MNNKKYNKLVRDRIPEIIRNNKGKPKIKILEEDEFIQELLNKLEEEVREVEGAKNEREELIKEIGDVYEVIEAIENFYKIDKRDIYRIKEKRKEERGGFQKRISLENVEE